MTKFTGHKALAALCSLFLMCEIQCVSTIQSPGIHQYLIERTRDHPVHLSRTKRTVEVTGIEGKDLMVCKMQQLQFNETRENLRRGDRLEETYVFVNESKKSLSVTWTKQHDNGRNTLIMVTTGMGLNAMPASTLWMSSDYGRTWANISARVENEAFYEENGMKRNPLNHAKVYLFSYSNALYVTENGGKSWRKTSLGQAEGNEGKATSEASLVFHSEPDFENFVAAITKENELYVTDDNFQSTGRKIAQQVKSATWGTRESMSPDCLYFTLGTEPLLSLKCFNPVLRVEKHIFDNVTHFDIQGRFMFVVVVNKIGIDLLVEDKYMMVSSDGGKNWNETNLPTIDGDRFYYVMGVSQGLIFMHVDNPKDTGDGTLYTSSDGLVYAESLRHHLFPNGYILNDFYKVVSMRGVFLTSQLRPVNSQGTSTITKITYNRGRQWGNISRPTGAECIDVVQAGCFLQISGAFSIYRGVKAQEPLSIKQAVGVILVHGHASNNLKTTDPDVFLSTDGGYSFRKVLTGPHLYKILDSGGLLVAVPMQPYHDLIKFSTDEGHCWHTYQFSTDPIKVTGLLAAPDNTSMVVTVVGYTRETKKWTFIVIDFSKVVTRQCTDGDYETWTPHKSLSEIPGREGCFLGKREEFKRLKPGSWCRNGYSYDMQRVTSACACSEEDFECDLGYYRREASAKCIRQANARPEHIDICKPGQVGDLNRFRSIGYRRTPENECDASNGFQPGVSGLINLVLTCTARDGTATQENESTGKEVVVTVSMLASFLVVFAVVLALKQHF